MESRKTTDWSFIRHEEGERFCGKPFGLEFFFASHFTSLQVTLIIKSCNERSDDFSSNNLCLQPKAKTASNILNFSKIENFEIFKAIKYYLGMILAEYAEDFEKIVYFHDIFHSSSITFLELFEETTTQMQEMEISNKNENIYKDLSFDPPPCLPYPAKHNASKSKSIRKVILIYLFLLICKT